MSLRCSPEAGRRGERSHPADDTEFSHGSRDRGRSRSSIDRFLSNITDRRVSARDVGAAGALSYPEGEAVPRGSAGLADSHLQVGLSTLVENRQQLQLRFSHTLPASAGERQEVLRSARVLLVAVAVQVSDDTDVLRGEHLLQASHSEIRRRSKSGSERDEPNFGGRVAVHNARRSRVL